MMMTKNQNLPVGGINFVRNTATANSTDNDWLLAICCCCFYCCCLLNITALTFPQAALSSQSAVLAGERKSANYSSVPFFVGYASYKSTVNIVSSSCHFIPGHDLSMLNDDTSSSVTKPCFFTDPLDF